MKLKIPPLLVVFAFAASMWVLSRTIEGGHFHFWGQEILATIVFIIAVLIIGMAVRHFKKSRTTVDPIHPGKATTLVVGGAYRYTRNPMYLGFFMMLISWIIYLGLTWNALLVPLFTWYMNVFQIYPEEQVLGEKFGDSFREFCSKVRRWV